MSDPVKKIGDARLAGRVIEAMAEGVTGDPLTNSECKEIGIPGSYCEPLNEVTKTVSHSSSDSTMAITPKERKYLERTGFSKSFVEALAGPDGKRALRARVKWLADHVVTRWWRKDFNRNDRMAMVWDLESFSFDAQPALPALMELGLEEEILQWAAINAVAAIAQNRSAQFYYLGKMCGAGEKGKEGLIAALEESEDEARCAVMALEKLREETAVPALIALAQREKGKDLEWLALAALSQMGKAAAPAVPLFIGALSDGTVPPGSFFRVAAGIEIAGIRPEDIRDILILLEEFEPTMTVGKERNPAPYWRAIANLGPEAVKELTRLLMNDQDLKVRKQTAFVLGKMAGYSIINQQAILALPLLESLRTNPSEDEALRNTAAKAIEEIVKEVW